LWEGIVKEEREKKVTLTTKIEGIWESAGGEKGPEVEEGLLVSPGNLPKIEGERAPPTQKRLRFGNLKRENQEGGKETHRRQTFAFRQSDLALMPRNSCFFNQA